MIQAAVGPDHAVRRRTFAERDLANGTGLRIEDAEGALALGSVPDLAIGGGRDVVGARAGGELEDPGRGSLGRRRLGGGLLGAGRSCEKEGGKGEGSVGHGDSPGRTGET